MQHVIYGLFDPITSELRYIGYTSNLKRRYNAHYKPSQLKLSTHKNSWLKSLLSKGVKADVFVIECCETAEELPCVEIELIEYYRSIGCDLVNGTSGGDGLSNGFKHSEDTRLKMSLSHRGQVAWNKGSATPRETLEKISSALKGRQAWNKGKLHSEETKKKMSEAQKKRFLRESN